MKFCVLLLSSQMKLIFVLCVLVHLDTNKKGTLMGGFGLLLTDHGLRAVPFLKDKKVKGKGKEREGEPKSKPVQETSGYIFPPHCPPENVRDDVNRHN